jgi:hypothetical protein
MDLNDLRMADWRIFGHNVENVAARGIGPRRFALGADEYARLYTNRTLPDVIHPRPRTRSFSRARVAAGCSRIVAKRTT